MRPTELEGYKDKPRVFLKIEIGGVYVGRILIVLDWASTPFTAENFRAIATNASQVPGQHYKDSKFHRVIKEFMAQGGDYQNGNGTGGESIYGHRFNDENLKKRFTHRGQVAMANSGRDSNGSQFFITFDACPHLNGRAVIFGQIVDRESYDVLSKIEDVATIKESSWVPAQDIVISDCGEIKILNIEDEPSGP